MRNPFNLPVAIMLAIGIPAVAAGNDQPHLTAACEEVLALSALPARLRDDASVYSLTADGFKLTRKKDGPFTCIVERNHAAAIIPQCADAAGADTIIPGIMKRTEWALDGISVDDRKLKFTELAEQKILRAPPRPGISYMMSNFNYVWNARSENMMRVPPHVMYYAPNISNADVGGSMQEAMGGNRGTPFVIEEGIHGYMTSFVEHASESEDVYAACEGQLPDAEDMVVDDQS